MIMKSANQQTRILELEKTYSTSNTFVIYHVFTTRSKKCTSKVVTPDDKRTMAENTASWSEPAQELKEDMTISSLNF